MSEKIALVVDDSKSARFAMRKFLEGFGYQVDAAENAGEAYTRLGARRPQVIFLDHVMPGTDGFDVMRALKSDPKTASIPIVICSSNEGESFAREARAKGAVNVLPKPPSTAHIAQVLEQLSLAPASAPAEVPPIIPADTRGLPPIANSTGATLPPSTMVPPVVPPKVQPIRQPEVTIEQAVLKSLRDAFTIPRSPNPAPVVPVSNAGWESALSPLRTEVAELRSRLASMELMVKRLSESELGPLVRQFAGREFDERIERANQLAQEQFRQLRSDIEAVLSSQSQRIDALIVGLRQALLDEAHETADRAVMNAAARISDQMSEAILRALGTDVVQRAER